MWPDTRGLPSPTMRSRIFDHMPSQPISARPCDPFAVFQRDGDAVTVLLEAVDAPAGLQRDQIAALAGLEERGVDVGAVGDRIRLAEALGEVGRRAECG